MLVQSLQGEDDLTYVKPCFVLGEPVLGSQESEKLPAGAVLEDEI